MDIEEAKKQLLKHKKEIDTKCISARYSKAIEAVLSELKKQDEEIKYWKEQAEGYQGLAEQIKEDIENRDRGNSNNE